MFDHPIRMVRAAFACLLLFAVAGWQPSAHAQEAEPAASDPVVQDETAAADAADAVEGDVETLIRILENDAARAQLIEQLRAAGTVPAAAETEPPAEPLAARLAEYTRDLAEGAAGIFARITEIAEYLGNVT